MIVMKDKNGIYRTIDKILTKDGREISEVLDHSGKTVFKNLAQLTSKLPLKFKSDGTSLKDYRIYGNTGGVGIRTANLFSSEFMQGIINSNTGKVEGSSNTITTKDFIPVKPDAVYSIKRFATNGYITLRFYNKDYEYIGHGGDNTIELISGATVTNPIGGETNFCCLSIINESIAYMRINDTSNDLSVKYMMAEGEYTAETMPPYEPYGYKIPVTVSGKNLFALSWWQGETIIRMTVDGDTIKGTTGTGYWGMYSLKPFTIKAGTPFSVQLHFTPVSTNYPECLGLAFYDADKTRVLNFMDKPSGIKRTLTCDSDIAYVALGISKLKQPNEYNEIADIRIMIEMGEEITEYEPYHAPVTTDIYLDAPLQKDEYISLADTGIQIPTISGTNILTVDTEIQPEKMYIRYKK